MKVFSSAVVVAVMQLLAMPAIAQIAVTDKAAARAARNEVGAEAARDFTPGEGDPKPPPMVRPTSVQINAGRMSRLQQGMEATQAFAPGEGDPKPQATEMLSRADRSAERRAKRAELSSASHAGALPSYGDNYGMRQ